MPLPVPAQGAGTTALFSSARRPYWKASTAEFPPPLHPKLIIPQKVLLPDCKPASDAPLPD